MSGTLKIVGVDPAPGGWHSVSVLIELSSGLIWCVTELPFDSFRHRNDSAFSADIVAVEDPRGVLFRGTSTKLWSETCARAGGVFWANRGAVWVAPHEARLTLSKLAGQPGIMPRKDSEVRALLKVVFGDDCFDVAKACPKRKNKRHGSDCPTCGGTGYATRAGVLSRLTSAHLRDAFVVALHAWKSR